MTQEKWQVRKAKLEDASRITRMAAAHKDVLMPYLLNSTIVGKYIDQFMVAEIPDVGVEESYILPKIFLRLDSNIGGAIHYIEQVDHKVGTPASDRVDCFLFYVKQVPEDIIEKFTLGTRRVAFLCHILCPGKGSFYATLEELKKQYEELWCWMSVKGPSYPSYKRYGFKFLEEREFWNVYKCDYSTFTLGIWSREVNNEGS